MKKSILLIYTGGTIGMIKDPKKKSLVPFNFDKVLETLPELKNSEIKLSNISIKNPIDSSNMNTQVWVEIANIIKANYKKYTGFVVLHGTDTMAFTASVMSFLLENLNKAIIFTGSQIPMGVRRTDAKENLITSIEIASSGKVNEVGVFFEDQLYRGNRTIKVNTEHFEAFQSPNYPILAQAGVSIKYTSSINKKTNEELIVHANLSNNVAILKLFPAIKIEVVKAILNSAKGIVIESFGSGNAGNSEELLALLKQAVQEDKILINITQCLHGRAVEEKYQTSELFVKSGVLCGKDLTTESAITKLMFLLGQDINLEEVRKKMQESLRGEMTI